MKKVSDVVITIGVFLSLLTLGFFLLMRSIWIFVDQAIKLPGGIAFTGLLTGILLGAVIFFLFVIGMRTYTKKKLNMLPIKILTYVFLFIDALSLILNVYLYLQMGSIRYEVIRELGFALPYIAAAVIVLFLTLVYPNSRLCRNGWFRALIILLVAGTSMYMIFDFGRVRITSGPILQEVDQDTLAVLWTTNVESTTEVSYGGDPEKLITVYEEEDGLLQANTRLHKVLLNITDMDEVYYFVRSRRIKQLYQNYASYGNTIVSPLIHYKNQLEKDKVTFYILNDVHGNQKIYKNFLTGNTYDFVVSNGDAVEVAEDFEAMTKKFLSPFGSYTEHNKLLYFVRGNHETRGAAARSLKEYLALPKDRYYYTFQAGPVYAIVLDSGEDKLDNHEEYSGLVDFKSYKEEETKWLEQVLASEEYKAATYRIALIHMPLNSYLEQKEEDYLKTNETAWRSMLSEAGIDAAFSGHTHTSLLLQPEDYDAAFPTVIGGGSAWEGEEYLAVRVEATSQQMIISYEDGNGNRKEVIQLRPKQEVTR